MGVKTAGIRWLMETSATQHVRGMAGLSHFSHLISIDFLGDLFAALSELLRTSGCLPGESDAQDS
eukprot:COSAG01_NODE_1999_length_8688_cov_6.237280_6_plen_65_part_00